MSETMNGNKADKIAKAWAKSYLKYLGYLNIREGSPKEGADIIFNIYRGFPDTHYEIKSTSTMGKPRNWHLTRNEIKKAIEVDRSEYQFVFVQILDGVVVSHTTMNIEEVCKYIYFNGFVPTIAFDPQNPSKVQNKVTYEDLVEYVALTDKFFG